MTARFCFNRKMTIRNSTRSDWPEIIQIYNEAIEKGFSTADLSPVTVESRGDWLNSHDCKEFPIYVFEAENEVRGWASVSPYRSGRMALRYTAEISYYVSKSHLRQGIASQLLDHTIEACQALGYRTLFGILMDKNEGSVGLLEKFGFEKWGHMPKIADFDGTECGHIYMGKRIA